MRRRLAFALTLALAAPALADGGAALRFDFTDLSSDEGRVRCALYGNADDFLKKTLREADAAIHGGRATCEFAAADLAPGAYAVAAYHDANNNGKLDTGVFGIPKEGLAFSNNARGFAGPPKWKKVTFAFTGAALAQTLKFRY